MIHDGPFVTGAITTVRIEYTAGPRGVRAGGRLRVGTPNTGWQRPVVPQPRYWDELVSGADRKYAPFHPVNTTAEVSSKGSASLYLEVMERMLVPDADPAYAYWRWWVTVKVEGEDLVEGDRIILTYGDPRFGTPGVRVQTFPEEDLSFSAYLDAGGDGRFVTIPGAPLPVDVVAGPAERLTVVVPSLIGPAETAPVRLAATDRCHCRPAAPLTGTFTLRGEGGEGATAAFRNEDHQTVLVKSSLLVRTNASTRLLAADAQGKVWGKGNPVVAVLDPLRLFWGDLHAQSEFHSMHSQKIDFRHASWSKGLSTGTPEECYLYGRDIACLDFMAITDQGACVSAGWEAHQAKTEEYNAPGRFVTFRGYEAGTSVGHRNVIYRGGGVEPPRDHRTFNFMPDTLYRYYKGRADVMIVPHHVKTWTDWRYHDPALEPLMEVYSCWGSSEREGFEVWDKGMTPGAGAQAGLAQGYRLGIIASTDNHVGMPGRSYPHDRQVHTGFKGGKVAVYAEALTREAIFDALKERHCYGTTGERIILRFFVNDRRMGSLFATDGREEPRTVRVDVVGTEEIDRVEVVRNNQDVHVAFGSGDRLAFEWNDASPMSGTTFYYVRVRQKDGEMAWSSPVWVELSK
ncbi:MAG: hypothetical protein A3F84_01970 [Candidatus Handelsmanbacteria bacterium RIFCSPLOWO2_12_FULL_64_10]|uniref:DUF3604 domain-containing protein n=1 Tax=Handelsmanbacteria sp. (strain RIFCSPLOWO2_12_FULL_64_10) TaxID=1817868 RepID=A0A1F6CA50_HANXR|nr:MAG: hypothetical protein A3F84_01970 [Candidatus Handelsmanbacteria bacterium RIFCSPLOWO2_12_FULL_64_10]